MSHLLNKNDERLAIDGGAPVRQVALPYGRQHISEKNIETVVEVLQSDFLTCGSRVSEFERAVSNEVGARFGIAMANGTAALHATFHALQIRPGDEVIVPAITFAATANAVLYNGGIPVFCDVERDTLLIDVASAKSKISKRTRAIVAVDYGGQPCDYDALQAITSDANLWLVDDACHALGSSYHNKKIGSLADCTIFSFHPVKSITTGEGGMVITDDQDLCASLRSFRNHGISTTVLDRETKGTWHYEMTDLGFNYRLTDIQCALGTSQLQDLPQWVERRRQIARSYDEALSHSQLFSPLKSYSDRGHGYHLYVIRIDLENCRVDRNTVFKAMRAEGINVNVHYIPVYLHPYYKKALKTGVGMCPVAEAEFERILTIPMFPSMTDEDVSDVLKALDKVERAYRTK